MAAFTLSPSTPQLFCSKNRIFSPPTKVLTVGWERGMKLTCQAADSVPAMERRELMKLLLFGAVGLPSAGILVPNSVNFYGGGIVAKDEVGNSIIASEWVKTHGPGDKTLAQGLKGDPTYLIMENNRTLATYGINAVCTHLGCIVPWNTVEKKFMCPCHGSQYNNEGTVLTGPASRSLELINVDIEDDKVVIAPWSKPDFTTGDIPWWSQTDMVV